MKELLLLNQVSLRQILDFLFEKHHAIISSDIPKDLILDEILTRTPTGVVIKHLNHQDVISGIPASEDGGFNKLIGFCPKSEKEYLLALQ